MPDRLFLQILNMSITASFVILAVIAARLLLKKAPHVISYALWAVVLFRLVCPFSFESVISLLPIKTNPIPANIGYQAVPKIDTGISIVNNSINSILPPATTAGSVNDMQIFTFLGSIVWQIGIVALLIYSVISLIELKHRLKDAVHETDNIYTSKNLCSPFVMGMFRPKIYLPANLTDDEKHYIILHERTHIKRLDHVVKIVSFAVLCLHWFNPLVWVAFFLCGKDMEMSCDEAVIKKLGADVKKDYSSSLLTLATGKRIVGGSPLAFGEGDTKSRIKNVLRYRKPALWVAVAAVLALIVISIGLLCDPMKKVYALSAFGYNPETGELHFTVSDEITSDLTLYLRVSGRTEQDGMGASLHLFEEESEKNSWVAGQSYDAMLPADELDFIELYGTVTRSSTGIVISEMAITMGADGSISTHKQDYIDKLSILRLKPTAERSAMAWAKNLQVESIVSAELVTTYGDENTRYRSYKQNQFADIVKLVNGSRGKYLPQPEPIAGGGMTLYITTSDGMRHSVGNNGNVYLEIDGDSFQLSRFAVDGWGWYRDGNAPVPDDFFEEDADFTAVTITEHVNGEDKASVNVTDPTEPLIAPIANSYYAGQSSRAFKMLQKSVFQNWVEYDNSGFVNQNLVNPKWDFDNFTKYIVLDANMNPTQSEDLYYCTFSDDNGKSGYIVMAYHGDSMSKTSRVETPYPYDLRANIDNITAKLVEAEIDLPTAEAARVQVLDAKQNNSREAICITDGNANQYLYYFDEVTIAP